MLKKCHHHLDSVHESYFAHMGFALSIAFKMIWGGIGALLHALCPAICQCTASKTIFALNDDMKARLAKTGHDHSHHHD